MPALTTKIHPAVVLLLLLAASEALLVYLLSQRAWFSEGDRYRVATLILLFALPGLALVGCLLKVNLRFTIWQLLVGLALLSIAFGWMTRPILEFRNARMASMSLRMAGCDLTDSGAATSDNARQIGAWSSLFLDGWERLPEDSKVTCIVLYSDQQVELLIKHADRLSSLKSITLYHVSTGSLKQLAAVLSSFPLIDVWAQNVIFPAGWFRDLGQLQSLSIQWNPPTNVAAIESADVIDLASLGQLGRFRAFGIGLDDEHAKILGRSRSLREVELRSTLVTESGKEALSRGSQSRLVSIGD